MRISHDVAELATQPCPRCLQSGTQSYDDEVPQLVTRWTREGCRLTLAGRDGVDDV